MRSPRTGSLSARHARRFRNRSALRLEPLEDRVVPSLYMVNTVTDEQDGGTLADPAGPDKLLSLREAISAANLTSGPSTIQLSSGTYSISLTGANEDNNATGDFDIKQSLTIQGAGRFNTFIDGAMLDRVFDIRGNINVTLQDVTIENGNPGASNNGGGIRVGTNSSGAQLTLTNVRIMNNTASQGAGLFFAGSNLTTNGGGINFNTATSNGGGIDITNASATVNITGTNFNTDITNQPTVVLSSCIAGAIASAANLNVTNCTLMNNQVMSPGSLDESAGAIAGAVAIGVTVSGSTILNNHIPLATLGTADAGGISSGAAISLTDTTVTGNTAGTTTGTASGEDAGGVTTLASLSLLRSHVDSNTLLSATLGQTTIGALVVGDAGGVVCDGIALTTSSINSNSAGQTTGTDKGSNAGGALSFATVISSMGTTGGGVASFQGSINQNQLHASSVGSSNAGGLLAIGGGAMTSSFIDQNTIDAMVVLDINAGGFNTGLSPGGVSLTSCFIDGNTVGQETGSTGTNNAGGLFSLDGVSMTDVAIRNNSVLGSILNQNQNGGGLVLDAQASSNLASMTITGNSTDASGGGILYFMPANIPAVRKSSFGKTLARPPVLEVDNSLISGNTAAGTGGGIEAEGSLILSADTISLNQAVGNGGGVTFVMPTILTARQPSTHIAAVTLQVKITDSTLSGNAVSRQGGSGGGLLLASPDNQPMTVTLTNDTFTLNTATFSAGLYITQQFTQSQFPLTATLTYLTVDHNSAQNGGGGITASNGATVQLQNNIVSNNTGGNFNKDNFSSFTDLHNNLSSDGTGSTFLTDPSDFNNTDPRLGPLQDNGGPTFTEALLQGSPAIDHAAAVAGITADQRGVIRTQGTSPDIGAFELVAHAHLLAVTSRSNGADTTIHVLNADTSDLPLLYTITPFTGWQGQVRVALGDINNDGVPDIIAAKGPTGDSEVRVFSGVDGTPLTGAQYDFTAFPGWTGGVFLTSGNFNGDNFADIVVTKDVGAAARVKVFSGADGSLISTFTAIAPPFTGGSRPAIADINGDAYNDLVIASGPGGPPVVEVFDGASVALGSADFRMANGVLAPKVLDHFFAFNDQNYLGGLLVTAGDLNSDGKAEIVLGTANLPPSMGHEMVNGNPVDLEVVDGANMSHQDFNIYPDSADGVRVAIVQDVRPPLKLTKARDAEDDNLSEIVTAPGAGGGSLGKILDGDSPSDPLIGQFTQPGDNPNGLCLAGH